MKKLDKHISKVYIKSFFLCLFAFTVIFLLSQLFKIMRFVADGAMTSGESVFYTIALLPKIFIDVIPFAVLLGGLISMQSMASNLELTSMKTSGISFFRIIRYPLVITTFITVFVYVLNDSIYPVANNYARELRGGSSVNDELPYAREGAFYRGSSDYVYYMRRVDRISNVGKDIQIIDMNKSFTDVERVIVARHGIWDPKKEVWILKDAYITNNGASKSRYLEKFSDPKYNDEPSKFIIQGKDPKTLTIAGIKKEMKTLKDQGGEIKELVKELAKRYSSPFAVLILSLIGMPLGSKFVRGMNTKSIALAVFLGYGYYLFEGIFEAIGKNLVINPFLAAWIPNIIFLAIGIYFVKEAEY